MTNVTVEQWKELLRDAGVSEAGMKKWHALFEERYPAAHESFLRWLGLSDEKIRAVRAIRQ